MASLWDQQFITSLSEGCKLEQKAHPGTLSMTQTWGRAVNTLDSRTPVKGTLTSQRNGLADFSGSSKNTSAKSCT